MAMGNISDDYFPYGYVTPLEPFREPYKYK